LNAPPTLAELDLTKKLSSVAQKLVDLAPEHSEQVRENKVSVAKAVRQVEHAKPCERPASRHHRPVISQLYHAHICALD